jgi:hypothetical protein
MSLYYDRKGKPISQEEFIARWRPEKEQIVARFQDARILISTVWLGIDHQFGIGRPILFETMIFIEDKDSIEPIFDRLQWRWHTEEEAKEAHDIIVNCYHENKDPEKAIEAWRASYKN